MKICKNCKEEFTGVRCKPCASLKKIAHRLANIEIYLAREKAWREANPEKTKAQSKKWAKENPEKKLAASNKWAKENPEKVKASYRKYDEKNKDKRSEYRKKWEKENPEKTRIKWHNYSSRKKANGGKLSKGLFEKLMKLQKGKCACCQKNLLKLESKKIHMDHIVPLIKGGANEDYNIQLLCQRCNNQKNAKDPILFMQSKGFLI